MNLLSFLSFLILAITLLTMVFGVVAYFLYKARERNKRVITLTYEAVLEREHTQMLFFTKE